MTERLIVDCTTGGTQTVPFSAAEASALQADQVAYQAAQTTKANDAATLRTAVQTQLAGIPGTAWTALTAAQKQAVIVALLYKLGALDRSLTVLPLANWL